ncbi:MAG: glucose-1-phosphate adenylyltransferase subunit GlgD [Clostridia bacterium]|nr:glucose-1-phosphate adenylyltransferase subunit GlgD [Clostridia bacterium]
MRPSDVMGIIFPNTHDKYMGDMTTRRAIGSVPFCGRYRLIDFSLSNLVNAGITKVGVITRENYQSLTDHLGSGRSWDLARKSGGLHMLTPYSTSTARIYEGKIDALAGSIKYLKSSKEKYVVLSEANLVSNIDMEDVVDRHIESGADFTICYKTGMLPRNDQDIMAFKWDADGFATEVTLPFEQKHCDYSLNIMVVDRELLIRLVSEAYALGKRSFASGIIQPQLDRLKVQGYKIEDFTAVIDGKESYFQANMQLIRDTDARRTLFRGGRPVYTKVRDDMPTKYGLSSRVSDCLIADGCQIEGEVTNCVLFRGVKVGKGTTLKNCIVLQDTVIGDNCDIRCAILDKNVTVNRGITLCGAESHPIYISKGETL